jgi:homoserine kinase
VKGSTSLQESPCRIFATPSSLANDILLFFIIAGNWGATLSPFFDFRFFLPVIISAVDKFMQESGEVAVRVPATTANLGPGFDVLGLAMSLWLQVTVSPAERHAMVLEGEGAGEIDTSPSNLIAVCCAKAFELANKPVPPLKYMVRSDIPFGCGCGSSSAAAVAGFVAGAVLSGLRLESRPKEEFLRIIAELEGHPDNAAPAIYGGAQLCFKDDGGHFRASRLRVPDELHCVLFVANDKMKKNTHATRGLIPQQVALGDAVHNMSRTALIVQAFSTNNTALLKECLDERFHQIHRARALFPHLAASIKAAMAAGAEYCFLSGAGPTVCAFVRGRRAETLLLPESERVVDKVASAMVSAALGQGVRGRCIITIPTELGVHFVGRAAVSRSVTDTVQHIASKY